MQKSTKYYLDTALSLGWGSDSKPDNERIKLLKKFIVGNKILDVGCGTGSYVAFLNSIGYECVGVDFVEDFIDEAKKTKRGIFIKARADNLPFKSKEFNTVILFDILEHGDDIKILNEAKRVCKSKILVIVPKKVDFELEQAGVIFRHYIDKSHLREYEEKDIKELAEKTDLKLVNLLRIHPLYNETIFLSLFSGATILKKIIRKIIFFILPKTLYFTEYFAVLKI